MSIAEEILASAEADLAIAREGEPTERLAAITRFMRAFEALAIEVAGGRATWAEAGDWAAHNADGLRSAREAVSDWEVEMGRINNHGGEEEAISALRRRSQHAFARAAFRGTSADELLAGFEDAEFDAELRDESERIALDAEAWHPASHTWWRQRDS
jgi:hypothetical protein